MCWALNERRNTEAEAEATFCVFANAWEAIKVMISRIQMIESYQCYFLQQEEIRKPCFIQVVRKELEKDIPDFKMRTQTSAG